MKQEKNTSDWTPDKKINWGLSLLIAVLTNFLVIFLESIGTISFGKNAFWIGTVAGLILATVVNCLRPRYNQAGHFWKPIYRFLLEQMPPPD